jgi:hypothetical protein
VTLVRRAAELVAGVEGKSVDRVLAEVATHMAASRRAVEASAELERILALPRRELDLSSYKALAKAITARWRYDDGRQKGTLELYPIQAAALAELYQYGGCVAPLGVGCGKTLISLFAPLITGCVRPMLLIPAKLKGKTRLDIARYGQHFRLGSLYVETYERIGRVQGAEILDAFQPDILILDEAQRVKNRSAAVTRRVRRYIQTHPSVRVVVLSGTITSRSIRDYAHLLEWAFRSRSPAPQVYDVVEEWAGAVDEKISSWGGGTGRLSAGALTQLYNLEEAERSRTDPIGAVRSAVRRRVLETPGVVSSTDAGISTSLWIDIQHKAVAPPTEEAIREMRKEWKTPCGYELTTPLEIWRHEMEMQLGYYYLWDPPAPGEWLAARSRWAKVVRTALASGGRLDSELQVSQAILRETNPLRVTAYTQDGPVDGREALEAWQAIRPTFVPNPVPTWIDDTYLRAAAKWAAQSPGIVWTSHVPFAERLAELTGLPYYGAQGKGRQRVGPKDHTLRATGLVIENEKGDRPIIASVPSNGEGRNLQMFSRNLVVCPPPTGQIWEQLIGRTHRQGQPEDEVSFEVWLGTRAAYSGMAQVLRDALYIQDSTGNPQRLAFADLVGLTLAQIDEAQDPERQSVD